MRWNEHVLVIIKYELAGKKRCWRERMRTGDNVGRVDGKWR
jgi:hypothetical protein